MTISIPTATQTEFTTGIDDTIVVSPASVPAAVRDTEEAFTTALKTKLDGIEAGADITDAVNVAAAGAAMAANNLSDLASGTLARSNLGVAINSDVQAWNANLDTLAGAMPGSKGLAILADTTSDAVLTELGFGAAGKAIAADATQQDVLDYLNATAADVSFLQNGTGAAIDRTVQDKLRDLATSPQDFGAVGDGATDDSSAVQSWLTDLVSNNRSGIVPDGTYLLNSAVTTSASGNDFAIFGQSMAGAVFKTPVTNTTGAILITDTSRTGQAIFENFTIVTEAAGGGTGLQFTQPEGGSQHQRSVVCRNVQVRGSDGSNDFFNTFIDFTGTWRPFIQSCTVDGPWVGTDQSNGSASYSADVGIDLTGTYDPTVDNCHVWGAYRSIKAHVYEDTISGVTDQGGGTVRVTVSNGPHPFTTGFNVTITGTTSYDGTYSVTNISSTEFDITATYVASETGTVHMATGPEAFRLSNNVFSHGRILIDFKRPKGREPLFLGHANHLNYRDSGFKIDGAKLVILTHNVIYNTDSSEEYTGVPYDFHFKDCSEYLVNTNVLHFGGHTDRVGVFVESDTNGEGDNGTVAHNIFSGTFSTAVWLSSGCMGVKVGPNIYSGTITTEVNDVSNANAIIDGNTETSGSWTPALTFGGGSTGLTTSTAAGVYRISGGLLTFRIDFTLTAKGTSTGNAEISLPTGLPGNKDITVNCGSSQWPIYSGMSSVTSPSARTVSASSLRLLEQGTGAVLNMSESNFTDTSAFTLVGTLYLI